MDKGTKFISIYYSIPTKSVFLIWNPISGARLEARNDRGRGEEVGPRRYRRRHLARHGIRVQRRHLRHQGRRQGRIHQVSRLKSQTRNKTTQYVQTVTVGLSWS
jgi:hypothetical protein